jgi:hypothetical protein
MTETSRTQLIVDPPFGAKMLSLSETAAFLSAQGVKDARTHLMSALREGKLSAVGEFEHEVRDWGDTDKWEASNYVIPATFWREHNAVAVRVIDEENVGDDASGSNWHGGFFWYRTGCEIEGHSETVTDARIWLKDLEPLLPGWQPPPLEPTLGRAADYGGLKENLGGRPAAKHGDAIATITLRLAEQPAEMLERYTVASLCLELSAEYQRLGNAPPSERNLETYASGILRVLRARKT